jgi:diphthine-ammonia ligase
MSERPFFCSWSGGKDSALAFYRALQDGAQPRRLLTMLTEGGERSRSHGLPVAVLWAQAEALGLPMEVRSATWSGYEAMFLETIRGFRAEGISHGVFGDIDLEPHREWVERVCGLADVAVMHPLWQEGRRKLLDELLAVGFRTTIIVVRDGVMDPCFLGRTLDAELIEELSSLGIDACGEGGEYHSVVTDMPGFRAPLQLVHRERHLRDGCWFLDVGLAGA